MDGVLQVYTASSITQALRCCYKYAWGCMCVCGCVDEGAGVLGCSEICSYHSHKDFGEGMMGAERMVGSGEVALLTNKSPFLLNRSCSCSVRIRAACLSHKTHSQLVKIV